MKKYLIKWGIIGIALSLMGCSHGGHSFRLWVYDADRELFVRDWEKKDVLTHRQAHGLICTDPKDVRKLKEKPSDSE